MNKYLIAIAFLLNGCTIYVADNNPYKSFVKLSRMVHTMVCKQHQGHPECVELSPVEFNASGAIIAENEEHSFVLTAGHFCQAVEADPTKLDAVFGSNMIPLEAREFFSEATFTSNFYSNDYRGVKYYSRLVAYEVERTDLCIVVTDRKMDFRPLHLADEDPEFGEKVYMASAPMGIHYDGATILLSGFYSGMFWHPYFGKPSSAITDMPILPGSSGAAILNEDGEIVSAAYATNMRFPQEAAGVPLFQIRKFINEHLELGERNYFREWFNKLFD